MKKLLFIVCSFLLAACSEYEANVSAGLQHWCEQRSDCVVGDPH